MNIESKDYTKYSEDYIDLHDFLGGERCVKAKAERYTPRLEGHSGKNLLYDQYRNFGILYNSLHRTRQGLKGAILRKPIDIQFPESMMGLLESTTSAGGSFSDLVRQVCDAVIGYGRCGVLVDIDETEQPYMAIYSAASILNWPLTITDITQQQEITLSETVEVPLNDGSGQTETVPQLRVLSIDKTGFYTVSIYQKKGETIDDWVLIGKPRYPAYKGKRLDHIPFVFLGSSNNTPKPSRPPLLDLLNILKGHWRLTVAYQYGLHFVGLPTPCFAGFDFDGNSKIALGPGATYYTPEPNAKSWFLQTDGSGLKEMVVGLDRLESQMAVVGARLLEGRRPGVETAETIKLRSSGDSATLADIAGNVEIGLTRALQYYGLWMGVPVENCLVLINKDFMSTRITPQEITALLQAVQSGQMSTDTFLWNLQQGEIIRPGRTIEEEVELLEEDKVKAARNNKALADLSGGFK